MEGPLIVTDPHVPSGTSNTPGSTGSGSVYTTTTTHVGAQTLTGLRLAVRAGETLYANTSNTGFELTWSGLRP